MTERRPGDVLAGRYRLDDLMSEAENGALWRSHDLVLSRTVALHLLDADDPRGAEMMRAAQASAQLVDVRILRVLDIDTYDGTTFVVNEWGEGDSLDHLLTREGPLSPRKAAWLVDEVASALTVAHEAGVAHGRLNPENVLIDDAGSVRLIGFAIEAALYGLPGDRIGIDVVDLAALLQATLTGRWAGLSESSLPRAPREEGSLLDRSRSYFLSPRQLQPGVPRVLDELCAEVLNRPHGRHAGPNSAREIHDVLARFVGDPGDVAWELAESASARTPIAFVGSTASPAVSAGAHTETDPEASSDEATGPLALTDLPTEAGTPIFADSGDVDWFSPRGSRPIPPPPLEPPADRPLFASTPHTPRTSAGESAGESVSANSLAPDSDIGSSTTVQPFTPNEWLFDAASGFEDDREGRGLGLRWALGLVVILALGSALVAALVLTQPEEKPPAAQEPSTAPTAQVITLTGVTARDFDPLSDPPTENSDLVSLANDGDLATAWRTSTYRQQFGPQGLKTGLGLILDLGKKSTVTGLDLTFKAPGTSLSIFISDEAPTADPTTLKDFSALQSLTVDTAEELTFVTPADGRYVTLWFTGLPRVGDGFRLDVAEVAVQGHAPAA